jgi:pyruvate kinase
MTGIRLNLSHGDIIHSEEWIHNFQKAQTSVGKSADLMIDLQGPELRLGNLDRRMVLKPGDNVLFSTGDKNCIAEEMQEDVRMIPVPEMAFSYLKPGQKVLLNDGMVLVEVKEPDRNAIKLCDNDGYSKNKCEKAVCGGQALGKVLRGGEISSRKSIALEGREIPSPTLTETDRQNLFHAREYGVTEVMLPFVRGREDIDHLRDALMSNGLHNVRIFAKIENLSGVRKLQEIMESADVIVIARGDLGNAVPLWELPALQKEIAGQCRENEISFMIVTQLLHSMIEAPIPTRAEVLDIYNAVLDGASHLMLTGETAVGAYPVEAMRYLIRTAKFGR